jgi:hypothetical protein
MGSGMTDRQQYVESSFRDVITESNKAVEKVAAWLRRKYPDARPGDVAYADVYESGGDVWLTKDGIECRVEVKWISTPFTQLIDWPFHDVIVDSVKCYDAPNDRPLLAYIFCNPSLNGCGVILPETKDHWRTRVAKNHPRHKRDIKYYVCHPRNVHWKYLP